MTQCKYIACFYLQRIVAWGKLDICALGRDAWLFYGIYQAFPESV